MGEFGNDLSKIIVQNNVVPNFWIFFVCIGLNNFIKCSKTVPGFEHYCDKYRVLMAFLLLCEKYILYIVTSNFWYAVYLCCLIKMCTPPKILFSNFVPGLKWCVWRDRKVSFDLRKENQFSCFFRGDGKLKFLLSFFFLVFGKGLKVFKYVYCFSKFL